MKCSWSEFGAVSSRTLGTIEESEVRLLAVLMLVGLKLEIMKEEVELKPKNYSCHNLDKQFVYIVYYILYNILS